MQNKKKLNKNAFFKTILTRFIKLERPSLNKEGGFQLLHAYFFTVDD